MNGAPIFGQTSGQAFCEGTKVSPFGIKALNVSVVLVELAMWRSQGPQCRGLQQAEIRQGLVQIHSAFGLDNVRASSFYFPSLLIYLPQPLTKHKYFTSLLLLVSCTLGNVFMLKLTIRVICRYWQMKQQGLVMLRHNYLAVVITLSDETAVLYF